MENEENSIELSGIFSDGYGINPKKLWKMQLDEHCGHGRGKYVKMVLSYLLSYTGSGNKEAWPSIQTISEDLECGKDLVIEALKNSEKLKMIRKIKMFPNDPMKTNNKYILDFVEVANIDLVNQKKPRHDSIYKTNDTASSDSRSRHFRPRKSELPTPEVATSDSNNNTINNNTINNNTRNSKIFSGFNNKPASGLKSKAWVKSRKKFKPPLLQEVIDYFKEKGYSEKIAVKAFESYSVADWIDSRGNPILNWKQKMINVWFKDEYKIKVAEKHHIIGFPDNNKAGKNAEPGC